MSNREYKRLPPKVKDKTLKSQLTKIANSASLNSPEIRKAFETAVIAHIQRYITDRTKQKEYLDFYKQKVINQSRHFYLSKYIFLNFI